MILFSVQSSSVPSLSAGMKAFLLAQLLVHLLSHACKAMKLWVKGSLSFQGCGICCPEFADEGLKLCSSGRAPQVGSFIPILYLWELSAVSFLIYWFHELGVLPSKDTKEMEQAAGKAELGE